MLGIAQHFEGTAEVQCIHAFMEGEEDVDVFMGVAALRNCTHLAELTVVRLRRVCWLFVRMARYTAAGIAVRLSKQVERRVQVTRPAMPQIVQVLFPRPSPARNYCGIASGLQWGHQRSAGSLILHSGQKSLARVSLD